MSGKKRKEWKDSDMLAAMKKVAEGITVSAAARMCAVPRRTLDDRVKGRVVHGSLPGPSTVLTKEEEDALVSYLIYMAERGFPLTMKMVLAFAWAIALRTGSADRFSPNGPSKHWWKNFKDRHPKLSLRKTDSLERSRAEALSPEVVNEYFNMLEKTITDNGLLNSPRQIYNCDETFLPLNECKEKAVTLKNAKTVYSQAMGSTEHITMLCTGSASGAALPPMIIYPRSYPGGQYRFGGPDDSIYAKSESGWVDSELFFAWFKKIFLKFAVPERPVLLLVDGHKSHMTLDLIDLARSENVILFCLPPHCTHALQPLDVSVFKSLKAHFSRALRAFCFTKKDFVVTKRDFARIVKEPFELSFSMSNIKHGFSKCGIFPLNRNAIESAKMLPSEMYQGGPSEKAGSLSDLSSSAHVQPSCSTPAESRPSSPRAESVASSDVVPESPTSVPPGSLGETPPLFSTPISTNSSITSPANSSIASPISNPLVAAGLVPSNLADILSTSSADEVYNKPKRRVIKSRVLTEQEFYDTLIEKDRQEKEKEQLKEQKRVEREKKKEEMEKQKKARAEEREKKRQEREKKKEEAKKRQGTRKRKRPPSPSLSESEEEIIATDEAGSSRSRRGVRLPARFRVDSDTSDDESGNESDTVCEKCQKREPDGLANSKNIFWIDCDSCDKWFHVYCVYGTNYTSQKLICENCLP